MDTDRSGGIDVVAQVSSDQKFFVVGELCRRQHCGGVARLCVSGEAWLTLEEEDGFV